MSIMHAEPEMLAATAGELQSINAVARAGNAAVAGPTTGVVPAAADLVSLLTASQFAAHAQLYQAISAEAMAVQEQLATTLGISAGSYAATEACQRRHDRLGEADAGLCSVTAGGQLRADVRRTRFGTDAGCRGGLGGAGRRVANHGVHLRRSDHWPGRRAMAGVLRGVHGGCRHAPGGVVEEHRRAGRASRQPSGGSGECL